MLLLKLTKTRLVKVKAQDFYVAIHVQYLKRYLMLITRACLGGSLKSATVPLFERCLNIRIAKRIARIPTVRTPRQTPVCIKVKAKIYYFSSNIQTIEEHLSQLKQYTSCS